MASQDEVKKTESDSIEQQKLKEENIDIEPQRDPDKPNHTKSDK